MTSSTEGVIVGTSRGQEWLMPWWWMHFRLHNSHPVTFVDFGDLSPEALNWCQSRGTVATLSLSDSFMASREAIDPASAKMWEAMHPDVWELRFEWFKKPFALMQSSYAKTVWLDLDCQVRGSIRPLFAVELGEGGFGVVPEPLWSQNLNRSRRIIGPDEIMYNAGVVVFNRGSKIVEEWVKQTVTRNHLFCSDQQLMAEILSTARLSFGSLSPCYNWTVDRGPNPEAVIYHWWGNSGKQLVKKQIAFMNEHLSCALSLIDITGAHAISTLRQF